MGAWTLENFRDEMDHPTGGVISDNTRKDRYINAAYFEVAGTIQFHKLIEAHTFNTADGTVAYNLPADHLGPKSLIDKTNDKRLLRVSPENFQFLDESTDGDPEKYAIYGGQLHLWPTPDAVNSMSYLHIVEPDELTVGNPTVLPATWDNAIWLMSIHYALMSLEEYERANAWFDRAIVYIRSRTTDEEFESETEAMGVWVPRSLSELQDRTQ